MLQGVTSDSRQDPRRDERVKVDAFVRVLGGNSEYVFRTRDLSRRGLFLYTRVAQAYPIEIGSRLDLELYDYNRHISCRVVVARIVESNTDEAERYPVGFGVEIAEIDPANRALLDALLERLAAPAP